MWFKEYKDYPLDEPLKKETLEPGKGFSGVEMREPNGWGSSYDLPDRSHRKGFLHRLLKRIFG